MPPETQFRGTWHNIQWLARGAHTVPGVPGRSSRQGRGDGDGDGGRGRGFFVGSGDGVAKCVGDRARKFRNPPRVPGAARWAQGPLGPTPRVTPRVKMPRRDGVRCPWGFSFHNVVYRTLNSVTGGRMFPVGTALNHAPSPPLVSASPSPYRVQSAPPDTPPPRVQGSPSSLGF